MNKFILSLRNGLHIHERLMARFLERRGWVVFYLPYRDRDCKGLCWLKLYKEERK